MTVLLALALSASMAPSVGVARELREGRPVVHVIVAGDLGATRVERDGPEVVITVGAEDEPFDQAPPPPPAQAPIKDIVVERWQKGLRVRVAVAETIPYEIRRDAQTLSVIFEVPAAQPSPPLSAELYPLLFPLPPGEASQQPDGLDADEATAGPASDAGGILLGPLTLQPTLASSYAAGTVGPSASSEPETGHYWQIIPRLGALLPVRASILRGAYEARIRPAALSTFDLVEPVSHIADASADWMATPRLNLDAGYHYARGALEVSEVDPGSEYFFDLARFTRDEVSGRAHYDFGTRLGLEAGARWARVRFAEDDAGFFDYDGRRLSGGVTYEVGYETRATLSASLDQTRPGPERPEAYLDQRALAFELNGRVAPLTTGTASVGWTSVDSPNAGPGGQQHSTWTARAALARDLSRTSRAILEALRGTYPSSFEDDGFYVASGVDLDVHLSLPLAVSFRGGTGYHVNGYRTPAADLGVPRRDRITRWSVGFGRPLTRFGYLRADYRWDRRDSNLDRFDFTNRTLLLELGVGLFGAGPAR